MGICDYDDDDGDTDGYNDDDDDDDDDCDYIHNKPDDKDKNTCSSPVANYLGPPPVWWLGPFICK